MKLKEPTLPNEKIREKERAVMYISNPIPSGVSDFKLIPLYLAP